MGDLWDFLFGVIIFVVLVCFILWAVSVSGDEPPPYKAKKINEAATIWYLSTWNSDDIPKYLNKTCAAVGKTVVDVKLSGRYSSEAIVKCK